MLVSNRQFYPVGEARPFFPREPPRGFAGAERGTPPSQAPRRLRPRLPRLPGSPRFPPPAPSPPKFLIPGTRFGDLTPVTSHPGPSGNSQRHFFVRNLTRGAGRKRARRKEECSTFEEEKREPQGQLPPSDRGRFGAGRAVWPSGRLPSPRPRGRQPARARPLPGPRTPTLSVTGLEPGQDSRGLPRLSLGLNFLWKLDVRPTWQLCHRWGAGI